MRLQIVLSHHMHYCCQKRRRTCVDRILFSDLDNTLIGDEAKVEQQFIDEWLSYKKEHNAMLVYNTGRPLDQVLEWIEAKRLVPVQYVICNQGMNIYHNRQLFKPWMRFMENTKFELNVLDDLVKELATKNAKLIRDSDGKCDLQIDRHDFMLRFFVFSQDWELCKKHYTQICQQLEDTTHLPYKWWIFKDAELEEKDYFSWSRGESSEKQTGFSICCELLHDQLNSSKHVAARFLLQELQRQQADRTIIPMWAGDGDNDLGMMRLHWRGIVVGNATKQLVDRANVQNSTIGPERIYISQERNAEGVLDGLRYWKSNACLNP